MVFDSETPWTKPTRLLCPWDFPGKNTGVGSYFLLPWIFSTQGSNSYLLHWLAGSLPLSYLGSAQPLVWIWAKLSLCLVTDIYKAFLCTAWIFSRQTSLNVLLSSWNLVFDGARWVSCTKFCQAALGAKTKFNVKWWCWSLLPRILCDFVFFLLVFKSGYTHSHGSRRKWINLDHIGLQGSLGQQKGSLGHPAHLGFIAQV